MKQQLMSIYEFKKGDIITRIKPSKSLKLPGEEKYEDRSFIGDSLVFLGIANASIYLERNQIKGIFDIIFDGPINLPLDLYDEGWSYYIDPYKIGENENNSKVPLSAETLRRELKIALEKENYEEAVDIKKQLKKLKDK